MCPADCPCTNRTSINDVSYREEEDCPTDEELIDAWWQYQCAECLTWWVERIWIDSRYTEITKQTGGKWPGVAMEDLLQKVAIEVWQKPKKIVCVAAYFRKLLRCAAYQASGIKRKTKVILIEEPMSIAEILEVPDADPRLDYLDDCLSLLPEKDRSLTQAVYFHQTSIIELAKTLRKGKQVLYKQISRARTKLGHCIESKA